MTHRFFPDKQIRNAQVARPVSRRVFAWLALLVGAGIMLAIGFGAGARKHVEAISLGYESEELRKQADALEERLRQLELERARAASPVALEERARRLGLERPKVQTGIRRPAQERRPAEGKRR